MQDIVKAGDLEKIDLKEFKYFEILGNPNTEDDKISVSLPNDKPTDSKLTIQADYSPSDSYLEDTLTKILSLRNT